jgi:hypothetical protein
VQASGLAEIGPKISFLGSLAGSWTRHQNRHMLLASHLAPAGLQSTIEETRHAEDAHCVVDAIVATIMSSRRQGSDADIDENLAALKDACRQTRRYREALPVLHRVAALNPNRRHEMTAEIALVHWHLGERTMAVATLTTAVAQQRNLPAWKRSLAFSLVAEIAAMVFGRSDLAAVCAHLGRSIVTPAPRRAPATTGRTVPKAVTPQATAADSTAEPGVGRRRAKGPVRQLSVLSSAANQYNLADLGTEARVATSTHSRPAVLGGTAA